MPIVHVDIAVFNLKALNFSFECSSFIHLTSLELTNLQLP